MCDASGSCWVFIAASSDSTSRIAVDPEKRQLAQKKEFERQWMISAQKVIDAHPELRSQDSPSTDFQRLLQILQNNPVYWERVDGFEYAYKVMREQVPKPVVQSWRSPGLFDDIILQARIDELVDRVTIRRALPVSPAPTAAKSPTIPHNHE